MLFWFLCLLFILFLVLEISTLLCTLWRVIKETFITFSAILLLFPPLVQELFLVIMACVDCALTTVNFVIAFSIYKVFPLFILNIDLIRDTLINLDLIRCELCEPRVVHSSLHLFLSIDAIVDDVLGGMVLVLPSILIFWLRASCSLLIYIGYGCQVKLRDIRHCVIGHRLITREFVLVELLLLLLLIQILRTLRDFGALLCNCLELFAMLPCLLMLLLLLL
jgi:hypothetical protein